MKKYNMPWYLNTFLIMVLAAFSIFIIPGLLAIFLAIKQQKSLNKFRNESIEAEKEASDFKNEVDKEVLDSIDMKKELERLKAKVSEAKNELKSSRRELEEIEDKIIVAEDTIEMESFSLYTPKWKFAISENYKEKTKEIVAMQRNDKR